MMLPRGRHAVALLVLALAGCTHLRSAGEFADIIDEAADRECQRPARPDFCAIWDSAQHAFKHQDFRTAQELGKKVEAAKPGMPDVHRLIADSAFALKDQAAGYYSQFNLRVHGCPATIAVEVGNDIFDLLRCPTATVRKTGSELDAIRTVRTRLLEDLNVDMPDELTRVVFVHACALGAVADARNAPTTLGCLWHAEHINEERLMQEVVHLKKDQKTTLFTQWEVDRAILQKVADEMFPAAEAQRDRYLFYQLIGDIITEHVQFQMGHATEYKAIADLELQVRQGQVQGCVAPLRQLLKEHLATVGRTRTDVRTGLTDELGYALSNALAKCYYHLNDLPRAAAIVREIRGQGAPRTFAEKLYLRQIAALELDEQKAKGSVTPDPKRLSSVKPFNFPPPVISHDEHVRQWETVAAGLPRVPKVIRGVISRLTPAAGGTRVSFQEAQIPEDKVDCHKTKHIDRIAPDGHLVYREECRITRHTVAARPDPITVPETLAVEEGMYLEALSSDDTTAIGIVSKSIAETAPLVRVGDVLIR